MVKLTLRELEAGAVDVRRRGLAGDVNAIARRLRGTGNRPFTVAMTRVMGRPWAIIGEAMPSTAGTADPGANFGMIGAH